ncbi:MAG: hypothetical protein H0V69_09210 [Acidimicrobiia bacterium]|nr:hypothetical protein [Acidimicrobiia bacterium]
MADGALAAIVRLEAELGATRKETNPYEHALVAHRLGLAYAETVSGQPQERLRRALACFDVAATLLDPRFHPIEHARVLTAAGSSRRSLGDPAAALGLFRRAAELAAGRVNADEAAAMANNVGLALLELGDVDGAIDQFDVAVAGFGTDSPDGRRGRTSALHNRGLSRAASGRPADLTVALCDYDDAVAGVAFDEAPLHHGLVQHSRAVAASALADAETGPDRAQAWREAAIEAFTAALDIFGWPDHAAQHGIASFNLGRMWARSDDVDELRRALLCFEDAVTAFDPRHQATPWRQAYDSLLAIEARLAPDHAGWSRVDHLLALLDADPQGAQRLMRGRLARWLPLPTAARDGALTAFVGAALRDGGDVGAGALVLLLSAVMELPVEAQSAALDALLAVRAEADENGREAIDRLVDRAVGEAVVGPQRVFVRDHLVAGGFERP